MQILIPNVCTPNTYVHDLACALESIGHEVFWGDDNLFYSQWRPDVILSQWPEGYFCSRYLLIGGIQNIQFHHLQALENKLKDLRQKTLILSFVHNVKPRPTGDRKLDAKLEKLFQISYGAAHGFVHLGEKSILELSNYYPSEVYQDKPSLVISHGLNEQLKQAYSQIDPAPIEKDPEFRIFVPGAIRFSSELTFLLRGFIKARIPNKKLAIAGGGQYLNGRHPVKPLRRAAIRAVPGVSLFGHRLDDRELCHQISAADMAIAPRLWATNSGIPYLAATFGKRCIAPNVGNLPEALKELNGILFAPDSSSSLAKAMETAYEQRHLTLPAISTCPSWHEIAQQIENFILELKAGVFNSH